MSEDLEIGILADEKIFYLAKHRLRDGTNEMTVVVDGQPDAAAIDPNVLRIDLNRVDNIKTVAIN